MNLLKCFAKGFLLILASTSFLTGCTKTLLKDEVNTSTSAHVECSDGEWVDDSSIAVLPIPVVAFIVPHADLHEIQAESRLNQCGESSQLVNRKVTINRTACIPAGLTRIISLGIWQWCPAHIDWEADVRSS